MIVRLKEQTSVKLEGIKALLCLLLCNNMNNLINIYLMWKQYLQCDLNPSDGLGNWFQMK